MSYLKLRSSIFSANPPNFTVQIEPHDCLSELFDNLGRFNTILLHFNRYTRCEGYIEGHDCSLSSTAELLCRCVVLKSCACTLCAVTCGTISLWDTSSSERWLERLGPAQCLTRQHTMLCNFLGYEHILAQGLFRLVFL